MGWPLGLVRKKARNFSSIKARHCASKAFVPQIFNLLFQEAPGVLGGGQEQN